MEKWRKNKRGIILTSLVVLLPMFVGILLWKRLPDQVIVHWGSDGTADGWGPKAEAVFGMPVFCLLVHWFCLAATIADPKEQRIGDKMFKLVMWICPVVSVLVGIMTLGTALSFEIDVNLVVQILLGAGLIAIGNYLPKCRQNYTVGIKLPWTLADEENWNRTHRMAGRLWMLCGVLLILNAFAGFLEEMTGVLAVILVMTFVPMGYSFWYYVSHKKE